MLSVVVLVIAHSPLREGSKLDSYTHRHIHMYIHTIMQNVLVATAL